MSTVTSFKYAPRSRLVLTALAVALSTLAIGAPAADAAKSGTSANVRSCQNGGWQQLVSSSGASFSSEKACTSYAARGGKLVPKSVVAPCLDGGWQNLVTSSGESFASEEECRSYAAGGGTLEPAGDPRCIGGRYLDLFRQDGSAFGSAVDCTSYVEAGGELVGLKATPSAPYGDGVYSFTATGSGLLPGSPVTFCFPADNFCTRFWQKQVAADGTFQATEEYLSCGDGYIFLTATTAEGATVQSRAVPEPC